MSLLNSYSSYPYPSPSLDQWPVQPPGQQTFDHVGPVRVVKRRVTANRKERRRTHSINSAFTGLRDCIPNVPSDTKLSKIKTLRLATSYICYLMTILEKPGTPLSAFKAEIAKKSETKEERRRKEAEEIAKTQTSGGRYNKNMDTAQRYDTARNAPAQYQHMLQMQAYQSHQASLQIHQQQHQHQQYQQQYPQQHPQHHLQQLQKQLYVPPIHDPSTPPTPPIPVVQDLNRGRTGWPQHVWANVMKQERI